MIIDAKSVHYRELNDLIHKAVEKGEGDIVLKNVNGQRYIGCGLSGELKITICGVPGNDLGAFLDGPTIIVNSNGQDGIGNTMNAGKLIIHGDAGDIPGHSMRGGKIFIAGDAGYRVGIHMKAYSNLYPVVIVGGHVRDFLGEYMAGGLIIVLGLGKNHNHNPLVPVLKEKKFEKSATTSLPHSRILAVTGVKEKKPEGKAGQGLKEISRNEGTFADKLVGNYCGIGMHGGEIFLRGEIEDYQLGKEVKKSAPASDDLRLLKEYLEEYCSYFSIELDGLIKSKFTKLSAATHRPYGKLYAY